ncbi:MAG TPA: hypothetical protein VEB21_03005 [Terriglobales bacterium]|nr:hypothetical protein [Terriglobales bacterium]
MKRIALPLALILFGLLCSEALLQLIAVASPLARERLTGTKASAIADTELGHRGDPALREEYDEHGFRNARRPERADIVAIGDSQTVGEGVRREDAWPQQLAALSGREVYQFAFGGYGPGQYRALLPEALALRPAVVVVGWYFGNDLADAFGWAYDRPRDPDLRHPDAGERKRIAAAGRTHGRLGQAWQDTVHAKRGLLDAPLRRWLQDHVLDRSLVVSLYKRSRSVLRGPRSAGAHKSWSRIEQVTAATSPSLLFPFQSSRSDRLRTVFTPRTRLAVLDSDDPRITEGLRLSLSLLEQIAAECRGKADLRVLLIPTKELVFAAELEERRDIPAELHRVLAAEQSLRRRAASQLERSAIAYSDALPALQALVAQGRHPYPEDWDGHPNRIGHAAIAAVVARELGLPAQPITP